METCLWLYESDSDYYDTACGEAFAFTNERLEDSRFKFCPYCGKPITQQQLAAMTAERDEIASRWKHEFELRCKVEEELESHAWSISPAMAQAKIDELNAKLTASEQQVARMREALQVLYDEQNDAPLENRRQQWQAAMTLASGALRETGALKGAE